MFKWISHPTQGPYAQVLMEYDLWDFQGFGPKRPTLALDDGERVAGRHLPKSGYLDRKRKLPDFFRGKQWMCSARGREVLEAFEPDHLSFHEIRLRLSKRGAEIEGPYYLVGIHEPVECIDIVRSEGWEMSPYPASVGWILARSRKLTAIRRDLVAGRHLVRDPRWRRGDWILASEEIIAALEKAKIRGWIPRDDMYALIEV